jgi:hypothetical protein
MRNSRPEGPFSRPAEFAGFNGAPRRTFGPRQRELLGLPAAEPSVDAMTAELRERIASASNANLISALRLRR